MVILAEIQTKICHLPNNRNILERIHQYWTRCIQCLIELIIIFYFITIELTASDPQKSQEDSEQKNIVSNTTMKMNDEKNQETRTNQESKNAFTHF